MLQIETGTQVSSGLSTRFMSSSCLGCLEKDSKVESRLSQPSVPSLINGVCQEDKGHVVGTVRAEERQ